MKIGGLIKFSLIDYPGKLAAVIFTQGCNLRCGYCHNSDLVLPECFGDLIKENEVFDFLKSRQGKIEGVVVSGGEPTIHKDIFLFLRKIQFLKFAIKLDTNGTNPAVLDRIIREGLVQFIAMDIKASQQNYPEVVGRNVDFEKIKMSIQLIKNSGIPYQFRTTMVPRIFSQEEKLDVLDLIQQDSNHVFQKFIPGKKVLDSQLELLKK